MGRMRRKMAKQLKSAVSSFRHGELPALAQSQADFDRAVSSYELTDIYDFAVSRLTSQPSYALLLLRRIVDHPARLPIQAFARNALALYLLDGYDRRHDENGALLQLLTAGLDSQVDHFPKDPAVQAATACAAFLASDWDEAARSLMSLTDPSWQAAILPNTFADLSLGSRPDFLMGENDDKLAAFETVVTWTRTNHPSLWPAVALITGELYIHQGAFLHAFSLYSSLLGEERQRPFVLTKLGETCWYMDRLAEAESYYRQAIDAMASGSHADTQTLRAARISLAVILCEQGTDISQAISLFEEHLAEGQPSQPVYHNLAMCHHWRQDYATSLEYCHKALKLGADETTMLLVAKNHQGLKQFASAVAWCAKALAYIEHAPPVSRIGKGNAQDIAFARPEWLSEKKRDIYHCLIHCHLEAGDYAAAADCLTQASSLWPRDPALASLQSTLTLLTAGQASTPVQAAAEHHLQQRALMAAIRQEMGKHYPSAQPLTLEFLATGEFLYRTHQHSAMDYSAVLLPYAKALETELTHCLIRRGYITDEARYTLGELLYILRKHMGPSALVAGISSVLDLRNAAAHQSATPIQAVEQIRRLFAEDWFSQLWA